GKQGCLVQRIAQRQGAGGEVGAPKPIRFLDKRWIETVDLLAECPESRGEVLAADHKVDVHFLTAAVGDLIKITVGSVPPADSVRQVGQKRGHAGRGETGAGPVA